VVRRRGGKLECRPEKPERDCNERSLLRRYGAGMKILTMYREEEYTEYREEQAESATVHDRGDHPGRRRRRAGLLNRS
jgi:hypothetical protein